MDVRRRWALKRQKHLLRLFATVDLPSNVGVQVWKARSVLPGVLADMRLGSYVAVRLLFHFNLLFNCLQLFLEFKTFLLL
jgi:hypothetical protein